MSTETWDKLRYLGCTYESLLEELSPYDYDANGKWAPKAPDGFPKREEIVIATLWNESYEGGAWVVWQRGGKLYEYKGSHCSCNSLNEDWAGKSPATEITLEAIALRDETYELERCAGDKGLAHVAWDALLEGHLLRGALA